MRIAIDGPAASGKGTIAKGLAQHFGLPHLDSGLLYRAVGAAVKNAVNDQFEAEAIQIAQTLKPNALDEEALGKPEIAQLAARVARIPEVRAGLNSVQVNFANQPGGAVFDGRDMGTRICPEAEVKLFITASADARAHRRTSQLLARGMDVNVEEMRAQLIARDESDKNNPAGAFYKAEDAHLLETSDLDIESALRAAIAIVDKALAEQKN